MSPSFSLDTSLTQQRAHIQVTRSLSSVKSTNTHTCSAHRQIAECKRAGGRRHDALLLIMLLLCCLCREPASREHSSAVQVNLQAEVPRCMKGSVEHSSSGSAVRTPCACRGAAQNPGELQSAGKQYTRSLQEKAGVYGVATRSVNASADMRQNKYTPFRSRPWLK